MMALHLAHSEVASLTQRLFRYSLQRVGTRCLLLQLLNLYHIYTDDGVRSAFHQFPAGFYRFYGVLVGSSPTLPSSNSYPLIDSYLLCYKLTLTASPSFGLCKGGDVLGHFL